MSNEIKRSECLVFVNQIDYEANPRLETLGRYIKSLRYLQGLCSDEDDILKYEYMINTLIIKHIALLQESISPFTKGENKSISKDLGNDIKNLTTSPYKVSDGNFSLINVEEMKKLYVIKKAVLLPSPIALPCKIMSKNKQYKFKTQIIMTQKNVLAYVHGELDYDSSQVNVNHNTLLTKVGKGIKNSPLLTKTRQSIQVK